MEDATMDGPPNPPNLAVRERLTQRKRKDEPAAPSQAQQTMAAVSAAVQAITDYRIHTADKSGWTSADWEAYHLVRQAVDVLRHEAVLPP